MRVLFVTSEAYPLVKTGGLGDVAGALPPALAALGDDVRVLLPAYPAVLAGAEDQREIADLGDPFGAGAARLLAARMPGSGQPLLLVDCPALFRRDGGPYLDAQGDDWPDNHLRFGLLCWAGAVLSHRMSPLDWRPDVVHCQDWQAGLVAAYLHDWGQPRPPVVQTIHNIAYQGRFPAGVLPSLRLPWSMYAIDGLEFYGDVSFLKAGIFYADHITTVSPTYAREIQGAPHGAGLEGLLAARAADLVGILNGADYGVWSPEHDPHLAQPYRPGDAAGKAANKRALQADTGLDIAPEAPLLVVVSRLTWHKGMDLVPAVLPAMLEAGAQLAVLGSGETGLEGAFRAAAAADPRQVFVHTGYSEALAHRLQAGGDILLMPSRFEPCGLTQLYAYRYGTVPLVHRTGGLADTVVDTGYDTLAAGTATGFVCERTEAADLQWCVERALALYRRPEQWRRIQAAGAALDFGWPPAAAAYRALFHSLSG